MKKGERARIRRRRTLRRVVLTASLLVLVAALSIGGTIAWLTATSEEVANTFTPSDINIELTESEKLDLKMVPGKVIAKDPKVTVEAGSEACWLFVKVDKSSNFDNFMTCAVASGWTPGDGTGEGKNGVPVGVYFREVGATSADTSFQVLAGDTDHADGIVTVKEEVTKAMMDDLTTNPTLTFTAYACQKDGISSAADAWAKVST